ncbi:hypothetical protein LRS10_13740 [Phenylobacterium sp. J426]|uniref:hypothetical protein n=1 Tax=Phenylobacterium sp. J426 TaxID=2898439 RepID=UPI002151CECF|nr:hypothetical protein [Phenylobacterium sp. J426]MCR5875156.1 hypothetical protein [Phenylobacterium sp. J426]
MNRISELDLLVRKHLAELSFQPISKKRIPIVVPRTLSLRENYGETVKLVHAIRTYALDGFKPLDLYFDGVQTVEPAALMVLTAEIQRCRNLRKIGGKPLVHGTYPKSPTVHETLRRMGFFKLLQIDENVPEGAGDPPESDVLVVPFLTDAEVKTERTAEFLDILTRIISGVVEMDDRAERYLYGAIIEAMKNAGEHAYKLKPQHQAMGRRWWLSGALDLARKEVSILLFDQGVGIPATLEPDLKTYAESLASDLRIHPSDSLMIEVATRSGQTSTGQAGRGQGFASMRKFVDACDDGDLLVYSNFGLYSYSRAGSSRSDEGTSLGGTLIQWRFRHSEKITGLDA